MEVWQERAFPSSAQLPPPSRQARFLGGLFDTSLEVSASRPLLVTRSGQEGGDDSLLDEGLDPAKFFALSRGGGGEGPGRKKRKRRRKRPGMRAAASSYGKRKVLIKLIKLSMIHKYEVK